MKVRVFTCFDPGGAMRCHGQHDEWKCTTSTSTFSAIFHFCVKKIGARILAQIEWRTLVVFYAQVLDGVSMRGAIQNIPCATFKLNGVVVWRMGVFYAVR
jgi:hypothetical protein